MEKKKRTGMGSYVLMAAVLIIIVLVAGVFYAKDWYYSGIKLAGTGDGTPVEVNIGEGTSSDQIGALLLEKGLIRSELMWKIYVRLNSPEFLAEHYNIPSNLSLEQIAEILQQPSANIDVWVTIQEGVTNKKVIDIFTEAESDFVGGNFTVAEFSQIVNNPDAVEFSSEIEAFLSTYKPSGKSLEGFLYPETYAFEDDATAQEVVEKLLRQFMSEVADYDLDSNELSFYEVLTLASIVERESFGEQDRGLVASVFSNRVEIDMALQSDATVNYATGKSNPRPTFEDLKIDSPYNTYKYAGLPPTPIGNPRIESIVASLEPETSEYYYFIHDDEDGKAYFGKTLSDHNRNVCKYLDETC